ncbi:DUF3618 domain-containing protein [Streptomyces hydrogenans]|uniref:DUF3618 domain-containing protein n=1 Tax=Streptomyces hydrogenans TaxID=1873719 RepID=UPI00278BEC9F|nr:DUF3618 domain-containing protein [Streptomyces hydrogenans]
MSHQPETKGSSPTPEVLRDQISQTREGLGRTVQALVAKADVKALAREQAAEAREKAVEVKEQAVVNAALVTDKLRDKAAHAARVVHDRTPEPVREKAGQAAATTRNHRGAIIAATVALTALVLAMRTRRQR